MANSELYNKLFRIPSDALKSIRTTLISNPNGNGVKRAKFLLKNGSITYQALKRLKNYFDYFNPETDDKVQYALAGGDIMKSFVDTTLNTNRDAVSRSKNIKQDTNVDVNLGTRATDVTNTLNENDKDLIKNALAVIVNNDNKILLLKRSKETEWMPEKWSLVGGGIEKGEKPQQAVEREINEETGLEIKKFVKTFSIQRNPNSIEYVFACRYEGEPTDVELNEENTNYGWFDVDEMNYLDIVPNLVEYITLSFKKYD